MLLCLRCGEKLIQTRGMNTRRRLGGKNKINETKAAATRVNISLVTVMLKLSIFIIDEFI